MEETMEPEATLRDWIRQHHVTWELGAWQELVDRHPTTVGFDLRLFGQHGRHVHASPGCRECVSLYEKLRAIALAAFPKEHRPTEYVIDPFQAALRMRPESEWAPEVQLTVHIVHRDGYLRPLDECEKRCAEEIQKTLRGLGVQAKSWSEGVYRRGPRVEGMEPLKPGERK
jgi:hypothetical protein